MVSPLTAKRDQQQETRQEEVMQEEVAAEVDHNYAGETYRVVYKAPGAKESSMADIIWLKKAAEVAMDAGIPHFNVRKKTVSKKFHSRAHRSLTVVEGVIELDNDPMRAEYDANEILSLVLPEYGQ